MAVKPRTNEFYEAIRSEHERLINVKEYGVQKFSDHWIKQKLASKFFREVRTIEDVIFYRV
ncbi:hypothetical protein KO504_16945 [Winogradskyella psychrotolerans]|uniref:hypothetical protein n=1 Tax=Winogradskyella psychrotolerans TaxID=1344585 RepID=UPI001C074BF5|nr:hypothetical protein [Winogradskyella psychrotolerans]MBU2923039.1 hypothetical protein [Winogradskyella psychrotolerans]